MEASAARTSRRARRARQAHDERGLRRWLRDRRDGGVGTLAFLLGGPDGHGPDVLATTASPSPSAR